MGTSAANHMCRRPLLNLDNFLLPTMQDSVRVCLAASQADTGAAHRQVTPGPRSQLLKNESAWLLVGSNLGHDVAAHSSGACLPSENLTTTNPSFKYSQQNGCCDYVTAACQHREKEDVPRFERVEGLGKCPGPGALLFSEPFGHYCKVLGVGGKLAANEV